MWDVIFIFCLFPVLITLLIPNFLLPLYIWLFLFIYSISSFPDSKRYSDKSGADAFGEAVLYIIISIIIISLIIRIVASLIIILVNKNKNQQEPKTSFDKLVEQINFIAYGILSGYYLALFLTNFLEYYRPAWQAYLIFLLTTIFFLTVSKFTNKYSGYIRYSSFKYLAYFCSSLSIIMLAVVISSFSFSVFASVETHKTVNRYADRQTEYCIQAEINTWLDLTPITTWRKRSGEWGPSGYHAVLVIQHNNVADLYNWSYKLRKWDYITTGFQPSSFASPSSLRCTLKHDYIKTIPFLLP